MFVSANPAIDSELAVNDTITLTFDNTPENVTVSTGTATITGETVTIAGPFTPGPLALTIVWEDGTQTLTYTIRLPVAFVSANPVAGVTLAVDDTITLTFDKRPSNLTVNIGIATVTNKKVKITGPFDPGPLALTVTWADGTQTLTYTIRPPVTFVSANPVAGATLVVSDTITLTFDKKPSNLTVSTGTATVTDKKVKSRVPSIRVHSL